ncbi:ABC transporter substrate-binding protein [Methylocapsa sp. S129]|uniref:ABC transporter substrate-binding protein n=1 Tax=Methylocapsa sp. S129 TaxID=1641869 RepID=UPI001AEF133E|nr:ABC transporter substrate-binding protein [Methylocapsa sp. S129]
MPANSNRRLTNWLNRLAIVIALGSGGAAAAFAQAAGEPVTIGVSGPLTGQNAQYGAQWKKGFDLALDEVNVKGVQGRPLQYVFEDSQADPRQSVAIAQKFVSDPKIVVEVGDFSSTASMAASSIYQRGGLVQFGFTNSHPNFTKGGDYMWSNSVSQADEQPRLAKYAADLGFKHVAVLYLNTDWGRSSQTIFTESAKSLGVDVVASEGYQPDEKDFRSTLVRVRDAKPDAIILISYYADGALITRQTRSVGLTQPIVASGSVYSPKFIELAGEAGNGVFTESNFFPNDTRPEVQSFVTKFKARYNEEPDDFNAVAYDAIILLAAVIDKYGVDRTAIRDGLAQIKDVPSVIYGKASFDTQTRRVAGARAVYLVVKNGQFVLWDGKKPNAS